MPHNIKSIRKEFRDRGVFYTDTALAEYMQSFIDIETTEVYDPTCGDGALLSQFPDATKKYGQEIDYGQLSVAHKRLQNFTGISGDTLSNPAFIDRKFKCIMANPPFSLKWTPPESDDRFNVAPVLPPPGKADFAFLLHCLYLLADDGIAVVLCSNGILYRGQREGKIRQWIIEQNYIDKVIAIPGDSFVDTTIATTLLVIRKNKQSKDILFVDKQTGLEKLVSYEEIEKNGFGLSFNRYNVVPAEAEEQIDIDISTRAVRDSMINSLRKDIEIDKILCGLRKDDHRSYLLELQSVIKEALASENHPKKKNDNQVELF
jgi:type I restriction-modification system DNA methylase subunit